MADQTLDEAFKQIGVLRSALNDAQRTITNMQRIGGFADSKTLSVRSKRIEDRVERLEYDAVMHKDVTAFTVDLVQNHLEGRHQANLDRDNSADTIMFRKIKRRLREWAEASGLMGKRHALSDVRKDENRLRPREAVAHS